MILVGFALLVGGSILLVTLIVGSTAASAGLLVFAGHSFAFLFGIPFRWGLVLACGLLVVICGAVGLIHDLRLQVSPPHAPPREHL